MNEPFSASALVGGWRLLAWETRDSAGNVGRPLGDHPEGRLLYSADGLMSVHMARASREAFREVSGNPFGGGPEQAAAAYRSYLAYSGRYRLDGDTVVHEVDLSLFPDWVGHSQARRVTLTGSRLVLGIPPQPLVGGGQQTGEVTWLRESPA